MRPCRNPSLPVAGTYLTRSLDKNDSTAQASILHPIAWYTLLLIVVLLRIRFSLRTVASIYRQCDARNVIGVITRKVDVGMGNILCGAPFIAPGR